MIIKTVKMIIKAVKMIIKTVKLIRVGESYTRHCEASHRSASRGCRPGHLQHNNSLRLWMMDYSRWIT